MVPMEPVHEDWADRRTPHALGASLMFLMGLRLAALALDLDLESGN